MPTFFVGTSFLFNLDIPAEEPTTPPVKHLNQIFGYMVRFAHSIYDLPTGMIRHFSNCQMSQCDIDFFIGYCN